jgi:tetratricopeptide (TPR) repeat protein
MTKRFFVGLAVAGLLSAAVVGLFVTRFARSFVAAVLHRPPPRPDDPRRDYAGPFQNLAPEVRYIRDQRCADCHPDQARSFALAPMGRSLLPVAQNAPLPLDQSVHNPFEAAGSLFAVETRNGQMVHRRIQAGPDGRPVAQLEWQVQYALGSGHQGYAYLTNRDGYLFETPISWYADRENLPGSLSPPPQPKAEHAQGGLPPSRGLWDLSPGFGPAFSLTGRTVVPDCLFCHANRVNPVPGSVNHYQEPIFDGYAIGCQRCHGPGELHKARQVSGPAAADIDYTIVNPQHLEPALQGAVCEQCHLQGKARLRRRGRDLYDYRPGLPLDRFWSIFVAAPGAKDSARAVGHVEQMYASRCFQASAGPEQLACLSCHDPHGHVPAAEHVAYYRERCLQCHAQHGCSLARAERLRRQPADSCIACHMPRYSTSDIVHAASTDHRILRRGSEGAVRKGRPPAADNWPIVSFYSSDNRAELERDRAVALVILARSGNSDAQAVVGRALGSLEPICRRDPDDLAAGEARGYALVFERRWADALAAFRLVLDRAPEQELVLVGAAGAAEELRDPETALGYWRRALAVNPWAPNYQRQLVLLLIEQKAWADAQAACAVWQRLDPMSTEASMALVQCLLEAGRKQEARQEFARLESLRPLDLRELQLRFGKRLRE